MSESYTESWLGGPKDCQFYTRTYKADEPKAVVVFLHGFIEHIGRYEHIHSAFRNRGISVFCFDQRGFGRTALDDKRSKSSVYGRTSWKDQAADIEWAVKHARSEFGDIPMFLVGHSMGGALALAFPTRVNGPPDSSTIALLSGVISSSPLISLTHPPNKITAWVGGKASNILPNLSIPAEVKPENLSHDPAVGQAYIHDPLVKMLTSLRLINDMLVGGQGLLDKDYGHWPAKLPILVYHGDKDEVTSYNSSTELFKKLPAQNKTYKTFPGGYHELHNEPDGVKEKVIEECISFIEAHLEPRSEPEVTAKL